jgi:PLP dependent protein
MDQLMDRRSELAAALDAVRARVAAACAASGRDPGEIALLAVTKNFPASDVALLADLGLTEFAENKDAEAVGKTAEFTALRPGASTRWHMVGRLQRNKARSVARWAAMVQSVDSDRLIDALSRAARNALDAGERTRPLEVLLQVSLDDDPARGGASITDLPGLANQIAASASLRLRGVMAVAPLGEPPAPYFERLAIAAKQLRTEHQEAIMVSAGMSGDLETAIKWGSTCVRVGTALLGARQLASQAGVEKGRP